MKVVLALLGVLSLYAGIFCDYCVHEVVSVCAEWNGLKATYGQNGQGYYDLPWSVEEAIASGRWQKLDQDHKLNVDVYSQHQDARMMLLFDKKGTIAGIRIGFYKDDIPAKAKQGGHTFEFDYDSVPMYEKANYFGRDLWHATVLLASPSLLAGGGRRKLNKNTDEVATNLYFSHNGKLTQISRDEKQPNKLFTEANCFPGMGKHYFYKMETAGDCRTREPFWILYNKGKLIGFGLAGYGSFDRRETKTQTYYELGDIPVPKIIRRPNKPVPPCVEDYVNRFGLISMHVFLKKDAAKITCPKEDFSPFPC